MNLLDIRSQLEEEITWRQNEMRFFHNQLSTMKTNEQKDCYRKALIVMLYSHYEGFSKTAFGIYADAINAENLLIHVVNKFIAACSLDPVFIAYENRDKKSSIFKNKLPEDAKLHRFARQIDFVENFEHFKEQTACISEKIVDTEDNLKYIVFKKLLFRLGLNYDCFEPYQTNIEKLLGRRNNIAHGAQKTGVSEKDYNEVKKDVFDIMNGIIEIIMQALEKKQYLKHPDLFEYVN
ncbi:MAG: MAE_28990/MAE_18760 family HEPN-like nuclease [Desulfitobacteriaceae bacterium]|nr:MAE_28990/MAE_18760 family HEPN-like nuclease [Desulfitobacteriaceae bacterium]